MSSPNLEFARMKNETLKRGRGGREGKGEWNFEKRRKKNRKSFEFLTMISNPVKKWTKNIFFAGICQFKRNLYEKKKI